MQQTDPAPGLPSRLIVDIGEPLNRFQQAIDKYDELGIEMKAALADLIECLTIKDDATYELTYSSYEMAPHPQKLCMAGTDDPVEIVESDLSTLSQIDQDAMNYIQAREEMGRALLKIFEDFKLFSHGRLFYQINTMLGTALIMDKIGVPFLAEERTRQRHVNNIDRQVALKSSFPAGRNRIPDVSSRPTELFNGFTPEDQARFRAVATLMGRS